MSRRSSKAMSRCRTTRQPFWLSKTALALFFLIFIACPTSLIALDRVVASRKGFPLSVFSSSYSWTYGPTAILVVILSLWRRVDYYYKLREPWRELLAGPSPADNTLLLDYITTFQVVSIARALKRRHYAVAASIAVFFLLKLIILISTTLFVVKETNFNTVLNVKMQDAFDAAKVWPTYEGFVVRESQPDALLFGGGSASSIWTYLRKLSNVTTDESDWRLPDDLVSQRFTSATGTSHVTSLECPVDIFVPKVSCEDATISESENTYVPTQNYTFVSETCANVGIIVHKVYSSNRVNCSHGPQRSYYGLLSPAEPLQDMELFDIRYAISVTDSKDKKLARSSALICKIGYGIATANATLDLLTGNVSIPKAALDGDLRTLQNLSSIAFAEMLWTNLKSLSQFLVVDEKIPTLKPSGPLGGNQPEAADVLFQLMYAQLGHPDNLDSLYQRSLLKNATISVFKGISREFARESLLVSKPLDTLANGLVTENRLHIRHLALWTMIAGFCLLAIICLLLFLMSGQFSWIQPMCGSLAGSAAILANSPNLQTVLAGSGHLVSKEMREKLAGIQFFAVAGPNGALEVKADSIFGSRRQAPSIKSQGKKHTWVPLAVRLPVIIATFTTPITAIGILELLYHVLRDKGHFIQIGEDLATLSYIIRIASTLVVFGITTMINNLDSTIVIFTPYSNLRSGSAPADRSILFHLLSVNPFLVMFKSLRRRQLGPAASNGATLIAGLLTIIVSGLWIPVNSLITNQPSTATVNKWDRTWFSDAADDGGAAVALNLIRFGGAGIPPGIWEDLVVPEVSLSDDSSTRRGANYTYDVWPLQPFLNCTAIPQNAISNTNMTYYVVAGVMGSNALLNGTLITVQPPGIDRRCSNSSINGFANLTFAMELRTRKHMWIGKYFDLHRSTAGQVSTDCPSIGMIFGSVTSDRTTDRNLTAVICSQGIRKVPTTVTYNGNPALRKIESMHARGASTGVQIPQNHTSKARTFGYKLEGFLNADLKPFTADSSVVSYDSFFNHLLLRPKGYSSNHLAGPRNVDKFVLAVTQDYNEYLRHVINRKLRAGDQSSVVDLLSATEDSPAKSLSRYSMITGTYSAKVTHLIVDGTSKLVLQVLLATMTVLSVFGFALVKIRGSLPRDPCSIGSTMALLADSQICDRGSGINPETAQYMSENQLKRVFDGWVFSLGWWSSGSSVAPSLTSEDIQGSDTARKLASGAGITVMQSEKRFGVDVGKASWS